VLPWEKPVLFSPTPPAAPPFIGQPSYYSSREIKELGKLAVQIRGSRSTGILLADDVIFTVYNTGPFAMKWEYKAEIRLKTLLQTEVCLRRLPDQYQDAGLSALVFGQSMEQMTALMGIGGDGRHNYFVLDGSFEHFYYLTSDHRGEFILQLLCAPEQRAVLDDILSEDLAPCRPNWVVENNAMDGENPVLFAYTCDMPRLRHFDTALKLHGKVGTLICFDFQEDVIRQVCGKRAKIQSLDFAKVKALFHEKDL